MVSYCWPNGLVLHVQFWSSPDPIGPHRGTQSKKILCMCLRGQVIVLFCSIHYLVVHVLVWSSQNALGTQKG